MNILWLGPKNEKLERKITERYRDEITYFDARIDEESEIIKGKDFIISFGYRYLISRAVIEKFPKRLINLHISYLPWNRGADPNFWSIAEDTKKGVTIHLIDSEVDTGDILVQREVFLEESDTLKSSYLRLKNEIEALLIENWSEIRDNRIIPVAQSKKEGSMHYKKDLEPYKYLLEEQGWDTPLHKLRGIAKK